MLHLLHLCLPSLIKSWTQCVWHTEQQAAVYISGQPYISYEVRLSFLACGPCAEMPGCLYHDSSSANRYQGIHPSFQNQKVKCYFVGLHTTCTLWREGCLASFRQPPLGLAILEELTLSQICAFVYSSA